MTDTLNPSPKSLGLASPALGPWFGYGLLVDSDLPSLPLPNSDLSVTVSLPPGAQWQTPASATRSYFVTTPVRPAAIRGLRQEDGKPAFSDNRLVVLLTLLPEVEQRLWALTHKLPSPDGTTPQSNAPGRARLRWLAMEVELPENNAFSFIKQLREDDSLSALDNDAERAEFLGLRLGSSLTNSDTPSSDLRRPDLASSVALKNGTGGEIESRLWCFDYLGRPVDPGAVANWWTYLATEVWDNLWVDSGEENPLTAQADPGRVVHLCNAQEGPIHPEVLARITLSGLTKTDGSNALYQTTTDAENTEFAPTLTFSPAADPNTDSAPLPRIAALPLGNYSAPADAAPFAGWTSEDLSVSQSLKRDFVRIACIDIEHHLTGLDRTSTNSPQANPATRNSPARNTAADSLLETSDAVAGRIMATMAGGEGTFVMSPVMDKLWGQTNPPANFGSGALPDTLSFDIHAIAGEGTPSASGNSVSDQCIALHFKSLPSGSWVRVWTHALDTQTGRRFRQDGGAGLADSEGSAWVVISLPDGDAGQEEDPVPMSFDASLVTGDGYRYYLNIRFKRPALVAGARLRLPEDSSAPDGYQLWICEQGKIMSPDDGSYASGQTLLAISSDDSTAPNLIDLNSLNENALSAATLPKTCSTADTLIITEPAFAQTPKGDLTEAPQSGTLIQRQRQKLNLSEMLVMGSPAPSQERREVVAYNAGNRTGIIGSVPGQASNHSAMPIQLGHPGVPASAEIMGIGYALAGPAADALKPIMDERSSTNIQSFIQKASQPLETPADNLQGPTQWATVLETSTYGVTGDSIVKALLAANPNFQPGQSWLDLKELIETELNQYTETPVDLDDYIDGDNFSNTALANAIDRMMRKTRKGTHEFASAITQAIGQAEDFIYLETPAIDALSAGSNTEQNSEKIELIGAIKQRWLERPDLRVILCVPENFLPNQTGKLEQVRKAGVQTALTELQFAGKDRVQLFSPIAGPGRPACLASTSVLIDDAFLFTGTTHLWRRGLTFDSSLAVGIFDENVTQGRPTAIRAARQQLLKNALGLSSDPLNNLLPEDPKDCFAAIARLNEAGGLNRINPNLYRKADNPPSDPDVEIWNPDGLPGGTTWALLFSSLTGASETEFNNAIR